nr:hypothetical protein [Palleronia pontilimi]
MQAPALRSSAARTEISLVHRNRSGAQPGKAPPPPARYSVSASTNRPSSATRRPRSTRSITRPGCPGTAAPAGVNRAGRDRSSVIDRSGLR